MFRKSLFVLSLVILLCASFVPVVASEPAECTDHYFYADNSVGWCVPDGWTVWMAYNGSVNDLNGLIYDMYGLGLNDVYRFGNATPIAMQVYPAIDNTAVYAQVYIGDYFQGYSSPEALIQDSYIKNQNGDEYDYQLDTKSADTPVGVIYLKYTKYNRLWVMYPMESLNKIYTVVVTAPTLAWNEKSPIFGTLLNISYSLFEASEPLDSSSVSQGSSNGGQYDHPVWFGGSILSVDYSTKKVQDTASSSPTVTESDSINSTFPGGTWEFFSDGTVTFTPQGIGVNLRDDLYPVSGNYTTNGSSITFNNGVYTITGGTLDIELYRESNIGGNKSYVYITGSLDLDSGVADITYQVSAGLSTTVGGGRTQVVTVDAHFTEQISQ